MINSPWLGFAQTAHDLCETDIGGWVRFPAPAWSSFFFCLAGIIIFYLAHKKKQKYLMVFGFVTVLEGFTSFSNHATVTFTGGVLDLTTMFIIAWMVLVPILWRIGILRTKFSWLVIAFGAGISSVINMFTGFGDPLFFSTVGLAIILTVILFREEKPKKIDRNLILAVVLFVAAFGFAIGDRLRVFCLPDNHVLQGIAVWHLLDSIAAMFLYFYLSKFKMPEWGKGI